METSTLDGEKNLKPRESIKKENFCRATVTVEDNNIEAEVDIYMKISIKHPSYILYEFDGHITYYDEKDQLQSTLVGIDSKNLLLKGAKVKNTKWVVGIVMYTGTETKIQMNATTAKSKMSQMEQKLHRMIMAIFVFQLALSIFSSFGRPVLLLITNINFKIASFLGFVGQTSAEIQSYQSAANNVIEGFRYFLLLSTLIPISLVVNLEVVRVLQVTFQKINYSLKSIDAEKGFIPNSSSVNEELGEIQYILSDKTGTLTQNKMVLRGIFIGDCYFGGEFNDDGPKRVFEPFIVQERQRRRVLDDLEDAFDRRLVHTVVLGDEALLPEPICLNFYPVRVNIPDQLNIISSNTLTLVRLNQRTLTHIIKTHNLDMSSDDDLHKNIAKSRSRRNLLERSEDEPRSIVLNESEAKLKVLNEQEIKEGLVPMSDLEEKEESIKLKSGSQSILQLPTPKTPREQHFESEDSHMMDSPMMSKMNTPAKIEVKRNSSIFNMYKNRIPDTIIVESPEEDEGMILRSYQDIIVEFLMCASVCHDCVVERNVSQKLTYHGPSPDEIAICKGANLIGCKFISKDSQGRCDLDIFGEERHPTVKIVRRVNCRHLSSTLTERGTLL